MNAAEVLAALRRHHYRAALVTELTISDEWADADMVDGAPLEVLPVHSRRIDALMFESRVRTGIEIKVSRADAERENWRKVRPWQRVVHRYVYACPAGLLDFPPVSGCGLWWVHEDGRIEVRRKTKINTTPEPLPQQVVQTLAYRAAGVAMPVDEMAI